MFPKQRREKIVSLINSSGYVTVEELARTFNVSVDSIRKDLKVLSDSGLCRREYGGAFRIEQEEPAEAEQEPASEPSPVVDPADEGRRAVARRAFMEINDGDAIFLDISRTNLFLADLIAAGDKKLIVTTNMMEIPQRTAGNPKVTTLLTGGYLNNNLTGFIGTATISLLEPLLFGKAFIGANGVNITSNAAMSFGMDDGMVKQKAIKNASYRYLLADKEKFHVHKGYRFASINDFTAVITDETDPEVLAGITRLGVPALC